jgi:hypothetical protein
VELGIRVSIKLPIASAESPRLSFRKLIRLLIMVLPTISAWVNSCGWKPDTLESVMLGSVHPRGVGEFTLPGVCKITLRKVPARKAGTLIRNPATGEMMKGAAKPASVRVRIRALSKLKSAAIS